ncbi:MAG: hypothetical protein WCB12_07710 [Bryobacteraceae bacterium]
MLQDDEVIGERSFFLEGNEGTAPAIVLRVGRPVQAKGEYAHCRFELIIHGPDAAVHEMTSGGLDPLDAIIGCFTLAGMNVAGLNESVFGGRLKWEGSPGGGPGLGLPTMEHGWPR